MNSKRLYYTLIALASLLVIGMFAATYEINNILVVRSNKLLTLKTKNSSLTQQQTELQQAKQDIKKYNDLYAISRVVVPQSKDQAQTVRQIVSLAQDNGVALQSISFPSSNLGGTGTTTTTGTTTKTVTPSAAATALSQLTPVPQIPGVYNLQLIVNSSTTKGSLATYPQLIGFLSALEQNRLTALVSSLTITPAAGDDGGVAVGSNLFSFSLTLDVYIKPGSAK